MGNFKKEIYEGWTVGDFIEHLQPQADMIMSGQSWKKPFVNKSELKKWCSENQPYYKHTVPEVVDYFAARYGL